MTAPADLTLHRGLIGPTEADDHLAGLLGEVEWSQRQITMFGKTHDEPRLTAWHGDPGTTYTYSGLALEPEPWTDRLLAIREVAQGATGCGFNSVLLNRYRDGDDSMGWHADDEPELGRHPVIASVSLGATRRFRLRPRAGAGEPLSMDLAHGDVLVMGAATQDGWLHSVPKTARPVGERLNLTFRLVDPS